MVGLDVLQPVGEVGHSGMTRTTRGRPGQPALAGPDAAHPSRRRSCGPTHSDGKPPARPAAASTTRILRELHWHNAVVDTVSSLHDRRQRRADWGRYSRWPGPYSWRRRATGSPASYRRRPRRVRRAGRQRAHPARSRACGSSSRPTSSGRSTRTWYFHAGSNHRQCGADAASGGRSTGATEPSYERRGVRLARLNCAHYESTRAQFEAFAALGWADHKMTHLLDAQQSTGRRSSATSSTTTCGPAARTTAPRQGCGRCRLVFDSYATGNHRQATSPW